MTLTPASLWHPTPAGFQRFGRSGIVIPSDGPPPINYTATDDVTITVKPTGAPQNIYRPFVISNPKTDLPNAPQDANYVVWPYPSPQSVFLEQATDALGTNDILVLPESALPYQVDSSQGFKNDTGHYYDMMRVKGRGIVGLGPGAIIQTSPSSFTAPRQTTEMRENVIYSIPNNSYFGNFEMRGQDFGTKNQSTGYNALKIKGSNTVVERVFFNAAHRGFKNAPPGEAGAVVMYQGSDIKVLNCEVECRDSTGTRVASSPIMWNLNTRPLQQDCYFHHSNAGMPTFWTCTNGTSRRVRSEYNGGGTGGLSGSCQNFELNSGTFLLEDCTFILDYHGASNNSGLHFSVGSNKPSVVFNVIRPVWGVAGGDTSNNPFSNPLAFSIQFMDTIYSPSPQKPSDFHLRDANNQPIPFKTSGVDGNLGPYYY